MFKKILICSVLFIFSFNLAFAQDVSKDEVFEAKVMEILKEKEVTREDGSKYFQQNIKLKGLEGKWQGKEVVFYGIDDFEVVSKNEYKKGDKVIVAYSKDVEGNENFYIVDYIRRDSLYFLAGLFCLVVLIIARWKGFRALLGLAVSFFIIMKFIVPKILDGGNPLFVSIIGSFIILIFIVYITEGFRQRSHLAIASILICLVITGVLSLVFTYLTRLTGSAQEEAMFLISLGKTAINFRGLLLAGIIIGTLGILDDMVISQIMATEQIKKANPELLNKEVFKKSFEIGKSHMSSMVNTLFLAYAGVSLPLLLLFNIDMPPFLEFSQVINNEIIATEIVRTFVGSIGLALAVPIATFISVYYLKVKE